MHNGSVSGSRLFPLFLATIAASLSGCTGLFQRPLPDQPATYAVRAEGPVLRVGAAERDVTPPVGGYMAGFSLARESDGVASPLKVRALVFEIGDPRSSASTTSA